MSVTKIFTELKVLQKELESQRPVPTCSSLVLSSCVSMRNAHMFQLQDQVIQFLTGFSDQFSVLKSRVIGGSISTTPWCCNKKGKEILLILMIQRFWSVQLRLLDTRKPQGQGRRANSNNYIGRNSNWGCIYCRKTGHTSETCYRKHGFPPNYGKGVQLVANATQQLQKTESKDEVVGNEQLQNNLHSILFQSLSFVIFWVVLSNFTSLSAFFWSSWRAVSLGDWWQSSSSSSCT